MDNAAKKNKNMSYSNSTISEYIGSNIYKIIGIPVQETILGEYKVKDKTKIVVACKDFTKPGTIIQDFASLKNTMIDSDENGYGTELKTILETIDSQKVVDQVELKNRFWDMFIVDALIGNMDRHNGNWGFLYDTLTDEVAIAPVYDCGSSLYPQADNKIMEKVLSDKLGVNLGYVYENIAAQILAANGHALYYHTFMNENTRHNYKIDFLLSKKNKICPIEVKSSGYNTHKSLDAFSEKYSERISEKYLVYTKDLKKDKDVLMLPIYLLPFLKV